MGLGALIIESFGNVDLPAYSGFYCWQFFSAAQLTVKTVTKLGGVGNVLWLCIAFYLQRDALNAAYLLLRLYTRPSDKGQGVIYLFIECQM